MIKTIRSNRKEFKEVKFKKGFNVVLADRIAESSDKDSRNGLGKSTLLEIIHFCLGCSTKPDENLRVPQLKDWTFILDIELNGKDFSISRNTTENNYVQIEGNFSDWPLKPEYDKDMDIYLMKIKEWTSVLRYLMFNIPINESEKHKYHPTFRSLISYFIRRGIGAFK